jgi:hypothetical protein
MAFENPLELIDFHTVEYDKRPDWHDLCERINRETAVTYFLDDDFIGGCVEHYSIWSRICLNLQFVRRAAAWRVRAAYFKISDDEWWWVQVKIYEEVAKRNSPKEKLCWREYGF